MEVLIVYVLLGILFRLLCGYKGLVETVLWPLGVAATLMVKISEGAEDEENGED